MPAVISFLRGVNVGGHRLIKMDDLRKLCESCGLSQVQTYVQSGNVVFHAPAKDVARVSARMEKAIEQACGFHADVFVRTAEEMRDVIRRNPFAAQAETDPNRVLVTFLAAVPGAAARARALAVPCVPEELRIDGREVYIYYPNGVGRAKLSLTVLERALGIPGTGRNWNSIKRLSAMAEALHGTAAKI